MTRSTPDRLLDAAARLFAERGFAGTSVADIEEAAGFTRRGGTLFKHFPSKQAVFAAMIDRHADAVRDALDLTSLLPLGDLRSELTLVARFVLAELAEEEPIHRALNCGGTEVPEARERMLVDVLEPGYRRSAELLQRWIGDTYQLRDAHATVTVLMGGLVNLRRNAWTFGRVPLDVDDDRAVAAWVDLAIGFIEQEQRSGATRSPRSS